jgi:GNAT superfamily N-acetyltransferase
MSLTIRSAGPADAELVYSYIRALAAYHDDLDLVTANARQIEEALSADPPHIHADIAEWDGKPVGGTIWVYMFSTFTGQRNIFLIDLYLDDAMRGKGLGRAMLQHLAARCIDEGVPKLEWTVMNHNKPAMGFYQALGADSSNLATTYWLEGDTLQAIAQP